MDLSNETTPEPNTSDSIAVDDSAPGESSTAAMPVLPSMTDLDRLAADLDQVDHTLAALDGAPAT